MKRTWLVSFAIIWMCLGSPLPSGAHRLDEYLQASRISVDRDRVSVEIDLTPGVEVAPEVISRIDSNGDGSISATEREVYANEVVRAMSLSVDGQAVQPILVDEQFPSMEEMTSGIGAIRLHVTARIPAVAPGPHEVFYRNAHRPEISVYLANALVPADDYIQISGQRRDYAQHELAVDYRLLPDSNAAPSLWWIAGLAVVGITGAAVVQSARRTSTRLS